MSTLVFGVISPHRVSVFGVIIPSYYNYSQGLSSHMISKDLSAHTVIIRVGCVF